MEQNGFAINGFMNDFRNLHGHVPEIPWNDMQQFLKFSSRENKNLITVALASLYDPVFYYSTHSDSQNKAIKISASYESMNMYVKLARELLFQNYLVNAPVVTEVQFQCTYFKVYDHTKGGIMSRQFIKRSHSHYLSHFISKLIVLPNCICINFARDLRI